MENFLRSSSSLSSASASPSLSPAKATATFACRIEEPELDRQTSDDFEARRVDEKDKKEVFSSWFSTPPPPEILWETENVQYLDKVRCHIGIQLQTLNPKDGSYTGRMKCHWNFRVLNSKDRTNPRIIVPGIRMPMITVSVEESRVWRHHEGDGDMTRAWAGTTVCSFAGTELFEVNDFPFDRQILDLNILECVWRTEKGSDEFFEGMNIVELTVETISTMPEWDTFAAVIEPLGVQQQASGPSHCMRFNLKLRLQRKEGYYVTQIFMVSTLITVAAVLPLALAPGDSHVGDRLALHSMGLLTLISFKYSISGEMPAVPYTTFVTEFLSNQIFTLIFVSAENIAAYKVVQNGYIKFAILNTFEDLLLYSILLFWLAYWLYVAFLKTRTPWSVVLASQTKTVESKEHADRGQLRAIKELQESSKVEAKAASAAELRQRHARAVVFDREGPLHTSMRPVHACNPPSSTPRKSSRW